MFLLPVKLGCEQRIVQFLFHFLLLTHISSAAMAFDWALSKKKMLGGLASMSINKAHLAQTLHAHLG